MRVKEESNKAGLKLNNQTTKIMASGLTISSQIEGEKVEATAYFLSWCADIQNYIKKVGSVLKRTR